MKSTRQPPSGIFLNGLQIYPEPENVFHNPGGDWNPGLGISYANDIYIYIYIFFIYHLHINFEFLTTKNDIPTNGGPLLFELKHAIMLTQKNKFNSSPLKK